MIHFHAFISIAPLYGLAKHIRICGSFTPSLVPEDTVGQKLENTKI